MAKRDHVAYAKLFVVGQDLAHERTNMRKFWQRRRTKLSRRCATREIELQLAEWDEDRDFDSIDHYFDDLNCFDPVAYVYDEAICDEFPELSAPAPATYFSLDAWRARRALGLPA